MIDIWGDEVEDDPWAPTPSMKLLCELPDTIINVRCEDNKIFAETLTGWYEILQDGTYVGILK